MVSRRRLLKDLAALGLLAPLLAACGGSSAPKVAERTEAPAAEAVASAEPTESSHAAEGPHWTYEGDEGPEHWGDLDPSFGTCAMGQGQSPVDLHPPAQGPDIDSIVFDYQPTKLNMVNNGHTIQVMYDPGSFLVLDDQRYELQQFHFHVPSEHHLNGLEFPMEAHLVHRSDEGNLAVVAVMFYGGVINKPRVMASIINTPTLNTIWAEFPSKGAKVASTDTVNVASLLPVDRRYMTYQGSLTTPPCTEGVRWIVLTAPVVVGLDHLEKFTSLVGRDNRPIQPLNGRDVGLGYAQAIERSAAP